MLQTTWRTLFTAFLLLSMSSLTPTVMAADDINLKKVAEAEKRSEAIAEAQGGLTLARDGETPLSALIEIGRAVQENDWEAATEFIDLRYLPKDINPEDGADLLRKLAILWNKQNILDLSQISDQPEGHLNDKLPSYRDLLGVLETSKGPVPVYLQRVPDGKKGKIWKISNATIAKVPELWDEYGYSPQIEALANVLPQFSMFHMENWQLLIFILCIFFGWIATGLISIAAKTIAAKFEHKLAGLTRFSGNTLRWFLYLTSLQYVALSLGLSIRARVWFDNSTLLYIANTILILGLVELYSAIKSKQLNDQDKSYSVALLRPMVAILKIIIVVVIALMWFESSGYNMATILTGLGVGSLAIALAAQKPLENVFGALTLYAARPIKPGDFCRFGTTMGVVEEIGLRSTRIRKLDRTVVHIPNSVFSSQELENFSVIDRRRYKHDLRISLDTSKEQLQMLLMELRKLLLSHPRVLEIAQRARFLAIERDAFVVNVNAYIDTGDINEYFGIAEDLNFHLLNILKQLDIHIAPVGQNVMLQNASSADVEVQQQAEQTIKQLIENDALPFPNYSEATRDEFKGTVPYPPVGSVTKPKDVMKSPEETDIEVEVKG
ncbi:mechanosensitive ion channel family protein [Shewanella sp. UCD-KL21]|uniref:mechanosensitive ion channel family protein n=1 Tax=Shewanella sp. UCD-KL21 TaxID=1917164 RepID=UPI000970AD0C|nr:mechanosensitive ion channel domain-containing protein [Shewanella sp. UCD-KL21]